MRLETILITFAFSYNVYSFWSVRSIYAYQLDSTLFDAGCTATLSIVSTPARTSGIFQLLNRTTSLLFNIIPEALFYASDFALKQTIDFWIIVTNLRSWHWKPSTSVELTKQVPPFLHSNLEQRSTTPIQPTWMSFLLTELLSKSADFPLIWTFEMQPFRLFLSLMWNLDNVVEAMSSESPPK